MKSSQEEVALFMAALPPRKGAQLILLSDLMADCSIDIQSLFESLFHSRGRPPAVAKNALRAVQSRLVNSGALDEISFQLWFRGRAILPAEVMSRVARELFRPFRNDPPSGLEVRELLLEGRARVASSRMPGSQDCLAVATFLAGLDPSNSAPIWPFLDEGLRMELRDLAGQAREEVSEPRVCLMVLSMISIELLHYGRTSPETGLALLEDQADLPDSAWNCIADGLTSISGRALPDEDSDYSPQGNFDLSLVPFEFHYLFGKNPSVN